jgi:receptor protein-tyrosine kinase
MASSAIRSRLFPNKTAPRLIGELLVEAERLREQDVKRILAAQRTQGGRFGEVARALGLIDEDDIARALARQFHYDAVPLGTTKFSAKLYTVARPHSQASEAIRALRGELTLRWFDRGQRTLAIGAARARAGTTVLAANLAVAFAQAGKRTLLIDCNLRHPQLHELFGLPSDPGLSDVLTERCELHDAIVRVEDFHLAVLCAGAVPDNPYELLSTDGFGHRLELLRAQYDVVLLDTPPLLHCADSQMIAARAQGYVLATRRHRTKLADIAAATERLAPTGAAVLGGVIVE